MDFTSYGCPRRPFGHLQTFDEVSMYTEDKKPEDRDGMTPFDVAAKHGHQQIIYFVLSDLD